ncbi:MAG: hypothetical protein Q9194_002671 [Teloschistes cf. exilis]
MPSAQRSGAQLGLQAEEEATSHEQSLLSPRRRLIPPNAAARQESRHADLNDDGDDDMVVRPSHMGHQSPLTQASSRVSPAGSSNPPNEDSDEIPNAPRGDTYDELFRPKTRAKKKFRREGEKDPDAPSESMLHQRIRHAQGRGLSVNESGVQLGTTRGEGETLEYLHTAKWIPAIFHEDLREYLLRYTDQLGEYDEEPEAGYDIFDRTSFHADAKSWRLAVRNTRPDVLFLWDPPDSTEQAYHPELWYHHDRIVLSCEKLPLKKWHELPLTISGQCEGLRIEAWRRLQPDLTMRDICGRMPRYTCKGHGRVQQTVKGNALANRVARDRSRIGIKPWFERLGSKKKTHRLLELMPEAVQLQILHDNNTACWRDLTESELTYVEEGNRGSEEALRKAGARRVSVAAREERLRQIEARARRKGNRASLKLHTVVQGAIEKPSRIKYGPLRGTRRGAPINVSTIDESGSNATPDREVQAASSREPTTMEHGEDAGVLTPPTPSSRSTRRQASPGEIQERRAVIQRNREGLSLEAKGGSRHAPGPQARQTNATTRAPSFSRPMLSFGEHDVDDPQNFNGSELFPPYAQQPAVEQQPRYSSSVHQPTTYEPLESQPPVHRTRDEPLAALEDWILPHHLRSDDGLQDLADVRPVHSNYGAQSSTMMQDPMDPIQQARSQDFQFVPGAERQAFHTAYGQGSSTFEGEDSTLPHQPQLPGYDGSMDYPEEGSSLGLIDWDQYKAAGWKHPSTKPESGQNE